MAPAGATPFQDVTYETGSAGWSLEQFGPQIMVLRTRPAPGEVATFLSCLPGARRLRLIFPAALPEPLGSARAARILIRARPTGSGPAEADAGTATLPDARTLVLSDDASGTGTAILRAIRALRADAPELEIVLHPGLDRPVLGRVSSLVIVPRFGAGASALLGHVASACEPGDKTRRD